jgi:hypothetical protein
MKKAAIVIAVILTALLASFSVVFFATQKKVAVT